MSTHALILTDAAIFPGSCCSTCLCIHGLLLVCVLTRDQTHNRDISGRCPNQLSYLASAVDFLNEITKQVLLSQFTNKEIKAQQLK